MSKEIKYKINRMKITFYLIPISCSKNGHVKRSRFLQMRGELFEIDDQ